MKSARLQAENLKIGYDTAGDAAGEPVFLIHGLGAERGMWKHQIGPLAEAGYVVVAPDMLGHGASSRVEELSLDDFVFEIDLLADHLGVNSFTIVGISMGGVIAQHYAVQRPQRLRSVVIADSFGDLQSLMERLIGMSQIVSFRILGLLGRDVFARVITSAYRPTFAKEARKYLYAQALQADIGQLILARKAINRVRVFAGLEQLDIPALVIVGDQCGQRFVDINRKIASHMRNSEFAVIKGAMDPSCLVKPARFNQLVLDFFGRQ